MAYRRGAFIGLEINPECISAVELGPPGREIILKRYGKIEPPPLLINPSLIDENIKDAENFKAVIRGLFNSAGINSRNISLALPDSSVKVSFLEFGDIPDDRGKIIELIKWNLKKTLPFPPDEASVDFQIIDTPSKESRSYRLLVALTRKAVLAQYESLLNACNLYPDVIAPSSFAVYNLYHDSFSEDEVCALLMLSGNRVTVMVARHGKLCFYRNKETGDEKDSFREILASLNYYHDVYGDMPVAAYLIAGGFESAGFRAEIERHFGGITVKHISMDNIVKGVAPSMDIFSGAAGAALRDDNNS